MVAYNFAPERRLAGGTKKTFAEVMDPGGHRPRSRTRPAWRAAHARDRGRDQELAGRRRRSTTTSRSRPSPPASRTTRRSGSPTLAGAGVTPADLATVASRTAKCTALGGIYTPADTIDHAGARAGRGPDEADRGGARHARTASNTTLTSQVTALTNEVNTAQDPGLRDACRRHADQAHRRLGQGQDRRLQGRRGHRQRAAAEGRQGHGVAHARRRPASSSWARRCWAPRRSRPTPPATPPRP